MTNLHFEKEITALLIVDPYNGFISEGGKVWGRLKQRQKQMIAFHTFCKS